MAKDRFWRSRTILHGCGRLRHQDEALPGCDQSRCSKYWDAVTYHEDVFPGNLTTFDDLMAAANTNLFSNTTSYVTDYLMPKNKSGVGYVVSEVSPPAGQGGVEIKGSNLAPAGDSRIWMNSDFVNQQMPT